MNTKISRQKLKITKYFSTTKEIPKTITKINNYGSSILPKQRKSSNSLLLNQLKTENNEINNYLTSSKINIKKKLKPNKTEYNFTQSNLNKINKTFDKPNIKFNKVKSLSDFNNDLIKSNYRSHMTQTSISLFGNKESDKSLNLKKLKKINNLELSNSFSLNKFKKVTYIDYQINQILSKKKEKINNEFDLINNNNKRNLSRSMLRAKYDNYYNYLNQKQDDNHINNTYINKTDNNNNIIINNKDNIKKEKFRVNKIYFEDELDNLFHKINIIKSNKNEFNNLVISLTNEELKLIYQNKDILPILIKNKNNNNNLTENEKSRTKPDRKFEGLKNVSFENNLLNLFIKGNPKDNKPLIKPDFPKVQYKENDKNNTSVNYDHIKYQPYSNSSNLNNKNTLSKSQIYKKINVKKNSETNDEDILKKDFIFLGYKNKLNATQYNKEEIKKGEKMFETWFSDVINKNKNKNKNKDININDIIYEKIIKKEEDEFKKIIIKKMMRQNSFKISNKINKNKDETFILPKETEEKIKNKNLNKSQIINEERVLDKIKRKFLIEIFSYIITPQGKLNLKLILNVDEKNDDDKKVNSNQTKNKIIMQSFIPKKILRNSKTKLISNPYIIQEEQNKKKEKEDNNNDKEESEESEEISDVNNVMNNLEYIPISLRKFFLEKYKITEKGRYSRLINLDTNKGLKGKNKTNKKKNYQKKLVIKVDNHNEKMVNNYLQNLQNKKIRENERSKSSRNKTKNNSKITQKEKSEVIHTKKEEFRIINLLGISIRIKKGIPPIEYLREYMRKKGIQSSEEFKSRVELKNKFTKLIYKLKLERKKRKHKTKATNRQNLSKLLDINYNADDLVKLANKGTSPDINATSKKLKFFDTSLIKSRKDVEKRKMQILLKFKNDIEYKAMTGDIDQTEMDMFNKLEEKMDKLMDLININEYMAKMEDYIGEFQEEINLREKSRKDEKRINGFIENLNYDINFKIKRKNYILHRFGKIYNFKNVNNMSKLNEI